MRPALVLLLVVAACGKRAAPSEENAGPPRELAPASSAGPSQGFELDGHPFSVTLSLEKPRFMQSDPVMVLVTYRAPQGPVRVEQSVPRNALGRNLDYRITVIDARGYVVPTRPLGESNGDSSGYRTVEPGKDFVDYLRLGSWVEKLAPGRYTLRADHYVLTRDADGGSRDFHPVLQAPFEVVPDDPAALGAIIDALGAKAVDRKRAWYVLDQLAAIDDPRTVAWWQKLKDDPDESVRSQAKRVLDARSVR